MLLAMGAPAAPAARAEPAGGSVPEPAIPTVVPADSAAQGLPIRRVGIVTRNIFDPAPGTLTGPLFSLGNALHIKTRASTVRSHLLFEPGDAWTSEVAEETARHLRSLQFLVPERIEPAVRDDSVDVVVETRDQWSTLIDFNIERGGGLTYGAFSFTERNLLGVGKELSFGYSEDPTGVSRQVFLYDPALGGTRARMRLGSSTGAGGAGSQFLLGVPFYALDTDLSWIAEGDRTTSVARLFQSGSEVAHLDRRVENLKFTVGRGGRAGPTVRRLSLSFLMFNRRLGPTQLEPAAPADFAGEEDNVRIRRLSGSVRLWRPEYIRRAFVNEMGPVEDFDVGQSATMELGYSPELFGGSADEAYARFALDIGTQQRFGFGVLRLSTESRIRASPTEMIRRIDGRWFTHWGPRHVTALAVLGIEGSRVPRDFQVVFGGLNGLRAYSVHALAGRRAWRVNVEDRWTLPADVAGVARIGTAVFYDAARAWGPGAGGSVWFQAGGAGLRLSIPRLAPSQVLRFDVAWPLSPTRDGRRDPVVTFGSTQAF